MQGLAKMNVREVLHANFIKERRKARTGGLDRAKAVLVMTEITDKNGEKHQWHSYMFKFEQETR